MGTTTVEQEQQQYLPEELFFEIFSQYLPVKSLLVCKSVCKSWLLLINSPEFVERHLQRSSAKAIEQSSQLAIYRKGDCLRSHFIYKSSSDVVNGGPSLRERRSSSMINLQIPYPFTSRATACRIGNSCLAAFRGSLYLLDYTDVRNLDVWVMKDYKNKIWVKEEKSFDLKSIILPSSNEVVYDEISVVAYIYIAPDAVIDEGIVMTLETDIPSIYDNEEVYHEVIYDPIKKVLQRFNVSDELKEDLGDSEWGEFTESLVSPKRGY